MLEDPTKKAQVISPLDRIFIGNVQKPQKNLSWLRGRVVWVVMNWLCHTTAQPYVEGNIAEESNNL